MPFAGPSGYWHIQQSLGKRVVFLGQAGLQIEQPLQIPDALAGLDIAFNCVLHAGQRAEHRGVVVAVHAERAEDAATGQRPPPP